MSVILSRQVIGGVDLRCEIQILCVDDVSLLVVQTFAEMGSFRGDEEPKKGNRQ
jgi:hypothetical protein